MSRIGKLAIEVPKDVIITLDGQHIKVKGKLGELDQNFNKEVTVTNIDGHIKVEPKGNDKRSRSMWGLTRTLISNMIHGVTNGFTIKLEINGVGFRSAVTGKYLTMYLGFSHEIKILIPNGIKIVCEKPTIVLISGYDKQKVGQLAAIIRNLRKPEPYKGKGIKYENEIILRKEGKTK